MWMIWPPLSEGFASPSLEAMALEPRTRERWIARWLIDVVWTFCGRRFHHPPLTAKNGESGSPTHLRDQYLRCSSPAGTEPCVPENAPTMTGRRYTAVKVSPTPMTTTRPFALRLFVALLACRKGMRIVRDELAAAIAYVIPRSQLKESTQRLRPVVWLYSVHVEGGPEGRASHIAYIGGGGPPRVAPGASTRPRSYGLPLRLHF